MANEGKIQILQTTTSPDYCLRHFTGSLTDVDIPTKTYTVAENIAARITTGGITSLLIQGSTGNDGTYTIVSATWDTDHTDIVVSEVIPDATVDGQAVVVNDYDTYVAKLPIVAAENQPMMELAANDYMYFGSGTAWFGMGLCMSTFGVGYGAFTWEFYATVDGWTEFVPRWDSTTSFTGHGVIVWGILDTWGTIAVDGQTAYWVRVKTATSPSTVATFFNLLRNITMFEPVKLESQTLQGGIYRSITNTIENTDITNYAEAGTLLITGLDTFQLSQEEVHQVKAWARDRNKIYVIDFARTDPPNYDNDAFIRNYVGKVFSINGNCESPHKEEFPFDIEIWFETIIRTVDASTTEEYVRTGEDTYVWTRDETSTTVGDGGDEFTVETT